MIWAIGAMSAPSGHAKPAPWVLSAKGYGPLHVGMTKPQTQKYVGKMVMNVDSVPDKGCEVVTVVANPHIYIMFIDQKLARVSLSDPNIRTDKGIGVGATEDEVKSAYSPLEIIPHTYANEPAHYLTYWDVPEKQGISFETDEGQTVRVIHVGNDAIRYVEGCL
jgi:hypothetical protein